MSITGFFNFFFSVKTAYKRQEFAMLA
jgi:hypothetical protein